MSVYDIILCLFNIHGLRNFSDCSMILVSKFMLQVMCYSQSMEFGIFMLQRISYVLPTIIILSDSQTGYGFSDLLVIKLRLTLLTMYAYSMQFATTK